MTVTVLRMNLTRTSLLNKMVSGEQRRTSGRQELGNPSLDVAQSWIYLNVKASVLTIIPRCALHVIYKQASPYKLLGNLHEAENLSP